MALHQLATRAEKLFSGATLVDGGVSLREANVIDGHGDAETRGVARNQDELLNWSSLVGSNQLIEEFQEAMCFADGRAMRFYLPACITTLLSYENPDELPSLFRGLIFHVRRPVSESCFNIFTQPQLIFVYDAVVFLRTRTRDDLITDMDEAVASSLRRLSRGG